MKMWEAIYFAIADMPEEKCPMETEETKSAYRKAYSFFVTPRKAKSMDDYIDADAMLNNTLETYRMEGFSAGFYAAIALLTEGGNIVNQGAALTYCS